MSQKTQDKSKEKNCETKDDVNYDSFIDLHEKEESVPEGSAQLKSVNQINNINNLPEEYKKSEDIKYDHDKYLKFEAEVIDKNSVTKNIEIYVYKNKSTIDLIKDWSGVEYIKDLPLKRVPIKHIKNNVYTIPKFKKFRRRGLDIEKIRELHKKGYIKYKPRKKSWDICSFNLSDRFKYTLIAYKGTWSFVLGYITVSSFLTSTILFSLVMIIFLFISGTFVHSLLDDIPRKKLAEIKSNSTQ